MLFVPVNPPSPLPNRIETVLVPLFELAKSCFPSRLKSPTTIDVGAEPTVTLVVPVNPPVPFPSLIETAEVQIGRASCRERVCYAV